MCAENGTVAVACAARSDESDIEQEDYLMNNAKRMSNMVIALMILSPLPAFAESGLYFGGSIGSATLSEDFRGFDIDADSTPYRFTLGIQLGDFFTIEGGYQDFGTFEDRFVAGGVPVAVELEADGITLGITGSLPLSGTLSLFGRAGAFYWDGDELLDSITQSSAEDTNPYYGGGATVSVTDRLKLVGDWTRYELDAIESDVISLGLTYRF